MSATAVRDEALGELTDLLDTDAVTDELTARWPQTAGPDTRLETVDRHWTRLVPGIRCTAVHEVRARREGIPHTMFVAADRTATGTTWSTAAEDTELTELGAALGPCPSARPLGDFEPASEIVPLRYRPGRRCTLLVRGEPVSGRGPRTIYAKVLHRGADRQRRLLAALAPLTSDWRGESIVAPLASPEPTGRVVLTEPVDGRSVWSALTSGSCPLAARGQLAEETGRVLALLHRGRQLVTVVGTRAGGPFDLDRRVRSIETYRPETARLARRLLRDLDGTDAGGSLVLNHGSFRFDQVLRRPDGGLVLVDLDSVCLGPPEADLGNCLAYLNWRRVRQPELAGDLPAVAEAFIEGYRRAGGTIRADQLARHHALSCLKIAWRRHANLDLAEWPLVPQLLVMAAEALRHPTTKPPHLTGAS